VPPPLARPPAAARRPDLGAFSSCPAVACSFVVHVEMRCGKISVFSSFRYYGRDPLRSPSQLIVQGKSIFFGSVRFDVICPVVRVPLELGSRAAGWAIAFGVSFLCGAVTGIPVGGCAFGLTLLLSPTFLPYS
jgi:hypothetical protein